MRLMCPRRRSLTRQTRRNAWKLRLDRDDAAAKIVKLKTQLKSAKDDLRARLEQEIAHLQQVVEEIGKTLDAADGGESGED